MSRGKRQIPPKTVKLTEAEKLKLENLRLKIGMAQAELGRLQGEYSELGEEIRKKYRIDDMRRYMFDPATGAGKRIENVAEGKS